ncbi:NucA/NucB deoxyribonuclease domain-containing protein [Amycolatopsis sp. Hca4]|uniref:NucA/NucB deoxyribonuclease domain-containing protein n=1 Tax=Amycolatopsis sp. Hca4 TaxID=2742131 RepID=UPI0034CD030B
MVRPDGSPCTSPIPRSRNLPNSSGTRRTTSQKHTRALRGSTFQDSKGRRTLHRAYYDTKLRDANRRTSVASCVKNWGPDYTVRDDGRTNDCDEYPFATTYEGSFTVTDSMIRSYAVRPVLSGHNQLVGSRLSTFVAEDHLLDGDAYYVTAMP